MLKGDVKKFGNVLLNNCFNIDGVVYFFFCVIWYNVVFGYYDVVFYYDNKNGVKYYIDIEII